MKICYFGIFDEYYSRNRILIKGLRRRGHDVILCVSRKQGIAKYFDLIQKHRQIKNEYDVMIVGFPGQQAMVLARLLTRKKIIFDAFTSLYDQAVNDRKILKKYSVKALYYWFLDGLACSLADVVILDTNEHIKYFSSTFKIRANKFIRVFVGSDDEDVKPLDIRREDLVDKFVVYFHGTYIPLQGVEYIIRASELVMEKDKDIHFTLFGTKIKNKFSNKKLNNITFFENVPYEDMKINMSKADICLGIFGETDKAKRVIPNKVFESIASNRAIITARTKASEELLTDKENILFCNISDANDLADKIVYLKNNPELREKIRDNGYKLFLDELKPEILVDKLIEDLKVYGIQ